MNIYTNFQLSDILWYKIGGKAKFVLEVSSKEDVYEALKFIQKNNIQKVFVCGWGSNLIFNDDYFDGAVIRISANENNPNNIRILKGGQLEAFSGNSLDTVITTAFTNNLIGLEWAGGLPGTVGAAVRGNVGAYGHEVKDSIQNVEVLVRDNNTFDLKTLLNGELNFVYRGSVIKENPERMIVLSATFQLHQATDPEVIQARAVYQEKINHRKSRHPLEYPNCGSIFKNIRDIEKVAKIIAMFPEIKELVEKKWYGKVAVAYFIEKFGLKGYRVGDAQISDKHALFIVNLGNAKAKDVLTLINMVQSKFIETFGFQLEVEVEIVA